jgi:hypothetical protein
MSRIVPAMKRQAMIFGAQFWVGEQINKGDYRCQSGVSGAMVKAYVRFDFFSYCYAVSWQQVVGSVQIDYALVESCSFFSWAAR